MIRRLLASAVFVAGLAVAAAVSTLTALAQAVPNPYAQLLHGKPALTLDEGRRVIGALREMHEAGLFTDEAMTDVQGMQMGHEALGIIASHGFSPQQWSDGMLKVSEGYYALALEEAGMAVTDKSPNIAVMRSLKDDFEALQEDMGAD